MRFFLDFEATRFSNRIIEIGCIAENGNEFKTLVKPGKKKIDKFITELTGITNEDIKEAPDADQAFKELFSFITQNNDNKPPLYYVYGNSDADFLKYTLHDMTYTPSQILVQSIMNNLIDYSTVVKNFFVTENNLALRKVYMLIRSKEEFHQKHDALEDAKMLYTVVETLQNKCKPEDLDTILLMPSQKIRTPARKQAPEIFRSWISGKKTAWKADTLGDENSWVVKCTSLNGNIKYFDSFDTAVLWIIAYFARNASPKKQEVINDIKQKIKKAIKENKNRYGFKWEYNPEGAIAAAGKKGE